MYNFGGWCVVGLGLYGLIGNRVHIKKNLNNCDII